jgi:hypothetical protein
MAFALVLPHQTYWGVVGQMPECITLMPSPPPSSMSIACARTCGHIEPTVGCGETIIFQDAYASLNPG